MVEFSCRQFRDLAAELALNVLGARERERALRHLDGCARCSEAIRVFTGVADGLVGSLPEAEPPAGFENRVVASLTPADPRRSRSRSRTSVTQAVAVLGAAALVGAVLVGEGLAGDDVDPGAVGLAPFDGSEERTVQYAPLLGENQQVGQAYLYRGDPTWIYLSLTPPKSSSNAGTVDCEVVHDDGTVTRVGSVTLNHGSAAWGGPAPAPPDSLVGARVVDHAGHMLAVARFRPRAARTVVDHSDHDTLQKRTARTGVRPG
jgi:Putative zinc-finger